MIRSYTTLRDSAIAALGEGAYRAVFSIVSAAAIVWLVVAYKGAPYVATWGIPEWWKPIAEFFPFPPIGLRGSTIIGWRCARESPRENL
jgi:uncharacterized membrane protein